MLTLALLALSAAPDKPSRFEADVLFYVNAERAAVGVAPLERDSRLTAAADLWCKLCHGTLAHYLPVEDCWGRNVPDLNGDGWCNVDERQIVCGWLGSGSEAGASITDAELVVWAWMQSPSHRAGLLNPYWTHAGVSRGWGVTYLEVGGP